MEDTSPPSQPIPQQHSQPDPGSRFTFTFSPNEPAENTFQPSPRSTKTTRSTQRGQGQRTRAGPKTPKTRSGGRGSRFSNANGISKDKTERYGDPSRISSARETIPPDVQALIDILQNMPPWHSSPEKIVREYRNRWLHVKELVIKNCTITTGSKLPFNRIPWPSLIPIADISTLTTGVMDAFFEVHGISPRQELQRWHSDKFSRLLPWIKENDHDTALQGSTRVAQYLTQRLRS